MERRRNPALMVGVALASVLVVAVPSAIATGHRSDPPRARPAAGSPSNPVVVSSGAFSASGPAGTLMHIRLTAPIDVPNYANRDHRVSIAMTGTWAAAVLSRDSTTNVSGATLTLARADAPFVCVHLTPCPDAAVYYSAVSGGSGGAATLDPGEYVLALAGPAGSHVSIELKGFYGTERITPLRGLYPMPYVAHSVPDLPSTYYPQHAKGDVRGDFVRPPLGRRMLAGIVLGIANPVGKGGGFGYAMCPGGYRLSKVETKTNPDVGCGGYSVEIGSRYLSDGSGSQTLPIPQYSNSTGYAVIMASAATGITEDVTGAAYGLDCNDQDCTTNAAAFVFALDT